VADKQETLKFCPLTSSTSGGFHICEEDRCALYVEDIRKCSLWLLGLFSGGTIVGWKRVVSTLEEHAKALENLAEELKRARRGSLPFMRR